ncbi:hypothetical protein K488DRAFT_82448 [Vararia minispora EC-137]|uniref:Uncharacterized protein n=1 Tax=Vararia minispora EC-137 TaxID=1314806 RepID=A0ACB8QVT2_9AGAM|nr:hypothetical protein K488DRAFT_82448 [Vararia minispora EC-137]
MGKGGLKPPKLKVKAYEPPDEPYVVVVRPPGKIGQVQAWLSAIFGKKEGVIEAWYHISWGSHLILRLISGLKISDIIGAHYWREWLPKVNVGDLERMSIVYEYNYRVMGDPVKQRQYLEDVVGPPDSKLSSAVKIDPYPKPYWADMPSEGRVRELVLPLPPSLRKPGVKAEQDPSIVDQARIHLSSIQQAADAKPELETKPALDVKLSVKTPVLDIKPGVDTKPNVDMNPGLAVKQELDAKPGLGIKTELDMTVEYGLGPRPDVKLELDVKPKTENDSSVLGVSPFLHSDSL